MGGNRGILGAETDLAFGFLWSHAKAEKNTFTFIGIILFIADGNKRSLIFLLVYVVLTFGF